MEWEEVHAADRHNSARRGGQWGGGHCGTGWISLHHVVLVYWHIYTAYLCHIMKSIMKIRHNYKYEWAQCNVEGKSLT